MDSLQRFSDLMSSLPGVALMAKRNPYPPENASIQHFLAFPSKRGWSLGSDGSLTPSHKSDGMVQRGGLALEDPASSGPKLGDFLQAWLFFGLIFNVVQIRGKSLLGFEELVRPDDCDDYFLSTRNLAGALKKWADWETEAVKDSRNEFKMRMIRLEIILERARQVVDHHCTYEEPWDIKKKYDNDVDSNKFVGDKLALLLMILGESLSQIHRNIMKEVTEIDSPVPLVPGWNNDDHIGWGQPAYVIMKMRKDRWCPRHVYLLRKQLGNQAILLWNAYTSQGNNETLLYHQSDPKPCDATHCKYNHGTLDNSGVYQTAHHSSCRVDVERCDCTGRGLLGPTMSEVEKILQEDKNNVFPLLQLQLKGDEVSGLEIIRFEVQDSKKVDEYVTISHVWSHGYGNKLQNKVWTCQLQFIARLLNKSHKNKRTPFWMDTLLIPVHSKDKLQNGELKAKKKAKNKAIAQIPTIFKHSHRTIVLDRGLLDMDISNSQATDRGMMVLASGWMRRLWTLQEAYLSRKGILIAFDENETGSVIRNFNDHILQAVKRKTSGNAEDRFDVISGRLQEQMEQGIMDRNSAQGRGKGQPPGMVLIADVWRAARWRTTSNLAHESVALATLLELEIVNPANDAADNIANAIWNWPWVEDAVQTMPSKTKLQELMREFWRTLEKKDEFKNCIPAGLIFLPGEKMALPGFGWAPRTFLAAEAVDYPDPLSILSSPTTLTPKGLLVDCPGYLLHFDDEVKEGYESKARSAIANNAEGAYFEFPTDNSFQEWYKVTPEGTPNPDIIKTLAQRRNRLAIITSRLSPRSKPPEIGLLVEVYQIQNGIFYSHIVMRIFIERTQAKPMEYHFDQECLIFGEPLGHRNTQKWCVDGYQVGECSDVDSSQHALVGLDMRRKKNQPSESGRISRMLSWSK